MQERNYAYLNFKFFGSIPDPTRNPKFRGGAGRGRHSIVQVFSGQGPERGQKLGAGRVLKIRVFCTPYYVRRNERRVPEYRSLVVDFLISVFLELSKVSCINMFQIRVVRSTF